LRNVAQNSFSGTRRIPNPRSSDDRVVVIDRATNTVLQRIAVADGLATEALSRSAVKGLFR
jgi:hypothetical protein